jgi:hypothetical protein
VSTEQPASDLLFAYSEVDAGVRLRYVRISIVLFLLLMPTFSLLDWIVYPEHFDEMLRVRLAFDVVFVGILVLTFTPLSRFIKAFGVFSAILAGCSISWMVLVSEGPFSPYYAGLNLILVVMSVLLPWTLAETAVVCAATIAIYRSLHPSYADAVLGTDSLARVREQPLLHGRNERHLHDRELFPVNTPFRRVPLEL